jgi:anti-sigma-K factor RskA
VSTPTEPHPELDALLGAYVLDALDPDERAAVERYLDANPRARAEVDDLRETAAVLAAAPVADTTAPPELWDRIAADLDTGDGDTVPPADELAARRGGRSRRAVWFTSVAAVAAVLVAALLAVQVLTLNDDLDDARDPANVAERFDRATDVDGAQQAQLVSDHGTARVVVLPDGTGYLVNDDLAPLTEDETYQLWAIVGDDASPRVISAGVLGADPTGAGFTIEAPVSGFALTVEQAGGVPVTANEPIATANLA